MDSRSLLRVTHLTLDGAASVCNVRGRAQLTRKRSEVNCVRCISWAFSNRVIYVLGIDEHQERDLLRAELSDGKLVKDCENVVAHYRAKLHAAEEDLKQISKLYLCAVAPGAE